MPSPRSKAGYAVFATDLASLERELYETLKELDDIPKQFTDAKIRSALRFALQPVLRKARNLTAVRTGNLRRAMSLLTFKKAKTSMHVGPTYKRGSYTNKLIADGYYAHMAYGSAIAFRKRITEPALNQNTQKVQFRFESKVNEILYKIKSKYNL